MPDWRSAYLCQIVRLQLPNCKLPFRGRDIAMQLRVKLDSLDQQLLQLQ